MRTRIAAHGPSRCSCRAVACGDRGVSRDMGRRPLVRRRWRLGSPFPARQGMPPRPRDRLGRLDNVGFDQGLIGVPSCPASLLKVSRGRRLPRVRMVPADRLCWPPGASLDSPLSARGRHGVIRAHWGASPHAVAPYSVSRDCSGTWTSAATSIVRRAPPDSRRLSGLPVFRVSLPARLHKGSNKMAGRIHLALRRHQRRVLSTLHRCCAPRPFCALSLPTCPPLRIRSRRDAETSCDRLRR